MGLLEDMYWWCCGRNWWIRVPVVFFYMFLIYQYWQDVAYWGVLDNVNLLIHEAGHLVFTPGGELWHMLGGTILQLLVPVFIGLYFMFWKVDYFAVGFAMIWLAVNLFNLAWYVGDAQEMMIPLVLGGGVHDWNYLFSRWNLLPFDDEVANGIRFGAWVVLWCGTVCSLVLLWWMKRCRVESAWGTPVLKVR